MSDLEGLDFVELAVCVDPMEAELFPAAIREKDIPHRTRRDDEGRLILEVASDWREEAEQALRRAKQVFFGGLDQTTQPRGIEEEEEPEDEGYGVFALDALPSPEETKQKAIWPAYVFAGLPGLGLGHLYAGKFQIFFYLFFCSLLGLLFFHFTGNFWSFGFNLFAWVADMGFAQAHVRDHNRRAERARQRMKEMEKAFYDSVQTGESN